MSTTIDDCSNPLKSWCYKCKKYTYYNSGGCVECSLSIVVTDHTTIVDDSYIKQEEVIDG